MPGKLRNVFRYFSSSFAVCVVVGMGVFGPEAMRVAAKQFSHSDPSEMTTCTRAFLGLDSSVLIAKELGEESSSESGFTWMDSGTRGRLVSLLVGAGAAYGEVA